MSVEYVEERPRRLFREWDIEITAEATWNYGDNRLGSELSIDFGGVLLTTGAARFLLEGTSAGWTTDSRAADRWHESRL